MSTTGSTLTRAQQAPAGTQRLHIAMVAPPYFDVPPTAYGGIEVVVADLDLDMISEVRKVWQFFRDRRPETYGPLTTQSVMAAAD